MYTTLVVAFETPLTAAVAAAVDDPTVYSEAAVVVTSLSLEVPAAVAPDAGAILLAFGIPVTTGLLPIAAGPPTLVGVLIVVTSTTCALFLGAGAPGALFLAAEAPPALGSRAEDMPEAVTDFFIHSTVSGAPAVPIFVVVALPAVVQEPAVELALYFASVIADAGLLVLSLLVVVPTVGYGWWRIGSVGCVLGAIGATVVSRGTPRTLF